MDGCAALSVVLACWRSPLASRPSRQGHARSACTDQSAVASKWCKAWGAVLVAWARRGEARRGGAGQGLALGLRHQAQRAMGERFALADVGKHGTRVGTGVIDEGDAGHGVAGFRHGGNGGSSFLPHAVTTALPQFP